MRPKPYFQEKVKFGCSLTLAPGATSVCLGFTQHRVLIHNLPPGGLGQLTSLNLIFLIYKIEIIILIGLLQDQGKEYTVHKMLNVPVETCNQPVFL